jgi:hypothetical protein
MTFSARVAVFLAGSALLAGGCAEGPTALDPGNPPEPSSYIVYYGSDPVYEALDRYDWAIVSSRFVPETHSRTRYFAYLTIGEVDIGSGIERELRKRMGAEISSLDLVQNVYWHSWVADIRSPVFQKVLLERIRDIGRRGFRGVFLDTLDSPVAFEEIHPVKGKGLGTALIAFVREVRRQNPSLMIVVNRGFSVLPDIADAISGVLFEDFCSMYDPARGGYVLVPPRDRDEGLSAVEAALRKNPRLVRLALDYGEAEDSVLKRTCGDMARHAGFIPFFSNRDLTAVR